MRLSTDKMLDVIEALAAKDCSLSELSRGSGLHRKVVGRVVSSLRRRNMVEPAGFQERAPGVAGQLPILWRWVGPKP